MLLGAVSVLFGALMIFMSGSIEIAQQRFNDRQEALSLLAFEAYSQALQQFERDTGVYPASLDALDTTAGYEHLIDTRRHALEYAVAGNVSDGAFRFNRAIIYRQRGVDYLEPTTYLNTPNNTCGTGDALAAASWCGRPQSLWNRFESRQHIVRRLGATREWGVRTLYRMVDGFNQSGKFPSAWSGGTMAPDEVRPLADLAGYGAMNSKTGCIGTYSFEEVPLTCEDFFSPVSQGTVLYQFVADDEIVLSVASGVFRADGTEILIALTIKPEV